MVFLLPHTRPRTLSPSTWISLLHITTLCPLFSRCLSYSTSRCMCVRVDTNNIWLWNVLMQLINASTFQCAFFPIFLYFWSKPHTHSRTHTLFSMREFFLKAIFGPFTSNAIHFVAIYANFFKSCIQIIITKSQQWKSVNGNGNGNVNKSEQTKREKSASVRVLAVASNVRRRSQIKYIK